MAPDRPAMDGWPAGIAPAVALVNPKYPHKRGRRCPRRLPALGLARSGSAATASPSRQARGGGCPAKSA